MSDNNCVQFVVTLDPNAEGLLFSIPGGCGAAPSGSLFYQVNCGPLTTVGTPLCLSGPGPHIITFCKPGNNANCYRITSIPKPMATPDVFTNDGCIANLWVTGLNPATIQWTSIAPGVQGQYNNYLNCSTGCSNVVVSPQPGYPAFIDYQVCGTVSGACSVGTFCDTARVNIYPTLSASIAPTNPTVCFGAPGTTITASASGGLPPYTYTWSNGMTGASIFVGAGTYTVSVTDATNCPAATASVTVTQFANPITANAGLDRVVCSQAPTVSLTGMVTGVTTGIWSGGSGTFAPSNTSLNLTYTLSPAEVAQGFVDLVLSTTNNGSCPGASDTVRISVVSFNTALNPDVDSVVCFGTATGSINLSPAGGNMPISFLWSN